MRNVEAMLREALDGGDYKVNTHAIESYELFFVKGRVETVRCTETFDQEVTVYVPHDGFLGDAQFFVYPSTTEAECRAAIAEAVEKARLICNKPYSLPENESGSYVVESNFASYPPEELAAEVANAIFAANTVEKGSLNSLEIFINRHTETVTNSRGICKTQTRYDAMAEAIPTYTDGDESVELYEQYLFSNFDREAITEEIAMMMAAAKARFAAQKPAGAICCKVVLNKAELAQLFDVVVKNLDYSSVFLHTNFFQKGEDIQKDATGDRITVTMAGAVAGNVRSAEFDSDGMALGQKRVIENGVALGCYGSNRFGQYLGEEPTGDVRCMVVTGGTAAPAEFAQGPYLEIVSMSRPQFNLHEDFIGGEVRLAYYHDGEQVHPLTGFTVSGSFRQALRTMRLSAKTTTWGAYQGPEKAILTDMRIF